MASRLDELVQGLFVPFSRIDYLRVTGPSQSLPLFAPFIHASIGTATSLRPVSSSPVAPAPLQRIFVARWGGRQWETGRIGRRKGQMGRSMAAEWLPAVEAARGSSRSHKTTQPHADRRRARCCWCVVRARAPGDSRYMESLGYPRADRTATPPVSPGVTGTRRMR